MDTEWCDNQEVLTANRRRILSKIRKKVDELEQKKVNKTNSIREANSTKILKSTEIKQ